MIKKNSDLCAVNIYDEEKVNRISLNLPIQKEVFSIAEIFKVLSDPTRLKIVIALSTEEMCVCDLTALTNISQSAISHQLRVLRNTKLVKFRKEGKMAYYSLDDMHIQYLISNVRDHINE